MAKVVILITPRLQDGHTIGQAWQEAGAPGVTFIESYGLRRLQEASNTMEVLPGMMSMLEMLRQSEQHNVTVISVVDDNVMVDRLIDAAIAVLGEIEKPDNGIIFTLDVERVIGITRNEASS